MGQINIFQPRQWQWEVDRALKRFTVLVVHRRAGKTHSAVNKLFKDVTETPNGRFAITKQKTLLEIQGTEIQGTAYLTGGRNSGTGTYFLNCLFVSLPTNSW